MPTPFSVMARLAAQLGDLDSRDEESVENFYVRTFPAFSEEIRENIFDWLSTLDAEPSEKDLKRFVAQLRKMPGFAVRQTDIVSGAIVERDTDIEQAQRI